MAESNKMKDRLVNKLMFQMGIVLVSCVFPITEVIAHLVEHTFLKKIIKNKIDVLE